ncbi:C2H2 finger domain transcription factor [Venturia nashicola]|uniref:C2H2 finger domain transcription factor n=1 Tax=Venturia nashicola TaxID=86259 RepID=A0A4Z1NGK2_9PEZI|nr:C2H2 finger domain transcription factor [Venturia nashicola]TLD18888.1 C2H2 finger domain transcription factor [Venturia nashicola]
MQDSTSKRIRSKTNPQEPSYPSFLDLPLELRREIYHYCLPPNPHAVCVGLFVPRYSLRSCQSTGLLSVSKQVNDEALDILYGQALCKFDLHLKKGPHFGEYFSEENKRRVRRIRILLDVDVDGDDDLEGVNLVAGLDSAILARLTKLEIVAAMPGLSRRYPSEERVRAAREKWVKGFEELIDYIAKATSPTLIIDVDDNDQEQTTVIVNRHLGKRCRKVRTDSGDLYFRR